MDKKSKIIVISILVCNVIFWWTLLLGGIYLIFNYSADIGEEYNFTNEETYKMYSKAEGYTLYENVESGVSFYYPEDWVIIQDTVDEVYIANLYINDGIAGDIYYSKIDDEESLFTEDDYDEYKNNIMVDGVMEFDDGWYEGTNVEQSLEVNGKKTFMWYNDMNPEGQKELQTFDLQYYSILEDDKVAFIRISARTEDMLKTIAGTLIY